MDATAVDGPIVARSSNEDDLIIEGEEIIAGEEMSALEEDFVAVPAEDVLLFRSAGVSPLRVLTIVALAFAVGSALLAALLLDSTARMDGMVSWNERLVWASGLLVAFCGFFTAVWMYERRIAASITLLADGKTLRVGTPTLFGMAEHQISVDNLITSHYHDGDRAGEEASSPPWLWVKVRGTRSFVVPLSGNIPNRDRLLEVLHGSA